MTSIYNVENLCCANCAAKIEKKLGEHPEVEEAVLTFTTRRLKITARDPDALLPELIEIAQTVEPDVIFVAVEDRHSRGQAHHDHCTCGHDPEHHDHCTCGHDHEHHDHCTCGHDHKHHDHCTCGHDHKHHDH